VREGDQLDWEYGTSEFLRHRPEIDTSRDSVAWYAVAHFPDGRPPLFTVIDRNVADRARAAGSAGDFGPWKTHYDAMAEKTAAIRLSKWLPLTTEAAYAVAADGAVVGPEATVEDAARSAEEQRTEIPAESEPEAPIDDPSPED
jgi:recombination protein RecT